MFADVAYFLIGHLVMALMLAVGLEARPADVAEIWRHPRLYLRALLVMEVGVPLLAMLTVIVFGLHGQIGALLLLMAVCPGAPFIAKGITRRGERHSPIGLNLFLLACMLAPLTVPIWVDILGRISPFHVDISSEVVLQKLAPDVLAPLLIGFAVRHFAPRAADVLGKVTHYFFVLAMAVAVVAALKLGAPVFLHVTAKVLVAVVVMVAGSALMGYWAGAPALVARHEAGVAAALGNPGLVLAIASVSYPGFKAAALLAAYLIARKLALLPFEIWMTRREAAAAHQTFRAV